MSTLIIDNNIHKHIEKYNLISIKDQFSSIITKYGQFDDEMTFVKKSESVDSTPNSIILYCVGLTSNNERYLILRELDSAVHITMQNNNLVEVKNIEISESEKMFPNSIGYQYTK